MDPSRNDPPTDPNLPRLGFEDIRKLEELRRQAQQRMENDERTAEWTVPPPPPLRGSGPEPPMVEMVYGAPPIFRPSQEGGPRMPAPVYGAPPVPAPVYGGPPVPARNTNAIIIGILTGLLVLIVAFLIASRL